MQPLPEFFKRKFQQKNEQDARCICTPLDKKDASELFNTASNVQWSTSFFAGISIPNEHTK